MTRSCGNPDEANDKPEIASDKSKRPPSVAPRSLRGRLAAGVLIIIPLVVTGLLVKFVYNGALEVGVWLVYWVSKASHWAFNLDGEPKWIDPQNAEWTEKTVAVVLTVLMLYLLGWLGTNVVGRRILDFFEGLVEQIPMVATVYSAIKRMVRSLSGSDSEDGEQQVVLIDFPHENMKAIAFMTNTLTDQVTKERMATVYLPTTPNPTSGYMLIVPMNKITQVDWTKEEALSMILSGGASARPDVYFHRPETGKPTPPPPLSGAAPGDDES